MKRYITLLSTLLLTLSTVHAQAPSDSIIVYNEEHPLIYEDAWDLWPYVFLNENGEPDGFNIDLLKMIFKELGIPYIVKLKPTLEAQADLKNRKSDLMLRMDANFSRNNASYGKSIVQLFTHSIVTPRDKALNIHTGADLQGHAVIVHEGSFSHHLIMDNRWAAQIIGYDDMQEAIQKVSAEDDGIIVWNTMSLKWLMKKFRTDNLEIEPIDLPYGEYKFFANDHHLLAQLDSVYSKLRANDQLTPIQNKWFYPERKETGIPSWIWYLTASLALVAIAIICYYIIYKVRERKMTKELRRQNDRLSVILNTSHVGLWTYNVASQIFTIINKTGKAEKSYASLEFSQLYDSEDFKTLIEGLRQIINEEREQATYFLKAKDKMNGSEKREYATTLSVLRYDKKTGKPSVILCSESDITDERKRQEEAKDMTLRYRSIFETAMVNMVRYNEKGIIVDVNERACQNFGISREEIIKEGITMQQVTGIDDIITDDFELFYATQILNEGGESRNMKGLLGTKKKYYEMRIIPVFDGEKRIGFFGSGREVTEVVNSYHKLQENINQLQEVNNSVTKYVQNIDYVLSVGGISMARYNLDTHILTIYSEVGKEKYALTQNRALSLVSDSSKKQALRLLNKMDNRQTGAIREDIKTTVRRKGGIPLYLQIHFIPIYKDRQVKEYFGMCRDISDIKAIEAKLAKETLRAQEVEVVKNAFLHNMSHEIRTPLNSVVGFSELFEMEHSPEDEAVFIKEIKECSAALLKLINDILFLSRLDAEMITINPRPTDFAAAFGSRCEAAWASYKKPEVNYIVRSPYKRLVLDIDEPNVAMIIDKIITNAAQYTTTGSVLARYDYIGDHLVVSVEDTGSGIAQDAIEHIFERFVTGANTGVGLGLSICHELVEYMGGTIQLKSAEGEGTTVWFTLPCKLIEKER